jgi:hypothetical protein
MSPRTLEAIPVLPPNPAVPGGDWLAEWDRLDFLELDAVETAPREARRMIRKRLPLWDLGHLAEASELVATELVTNSVGATGPHAASTRLPPVLVWLLGGEKTIAVAVWDSAPGVPVRREAALLDEAGRGVWLVEELSQAWDFWFPVAPFTGKVTMAIIG